MTIISDPRADMPALNEPQSADAEDDEAFSRFFDQYQESVYSVAWRALGDEALASDVTETVFTQAWRASAHRGARGPEQRRWLLWLTHSMALSAKATAQPHADGALSDAQVPGKYSTPAPSLPNAQGVVELAFWSGLSCREIAESSRNTIEDVLTRMREGLHLLVGECAPALASQNCRVSTGEAAPPASSS